MSLNELRDRVFKTAVEHGWWDDEEPNFPEKLALIHSEISEALESYRNREPIAIPFLRLKEDGTAKPEGVPIELADAIIRILDLCGYYGIDIEAAVLEKMTYNETRPYRHGDKVC